MGDESRFRYQRNDGAAHARGTASSAGADPLAELARLIGEKDPFDDFPEQPAARQPQAAPQLAAPQVPAPQVPAQRAYADPRTVHRAPMPPARQPAPEPQWGYDDDEEDEYAPQPAPVARQAAAARVASPTPAPQDSTVRLGYGSLARSAPARPAAAPVPQDNDDDYDDYDDAPQAQAQPARAYRDERAYQPQQARSPQGHAADAYAARAGYGRQAPQARDPAPQARDAYEDDGYDDPRQARGYRAAQHDDEAAYAYSAERRDEDGYDDDYETYDPEYADDGYMPPHGDDVYDPEPRRRKGRMALLLGVSVIGLLVAGAAGVFAYNMAVGKHASLGSGNGGPPVIKADAGSPKTVNPAPVASADNQQKLIYDRIGGPSSAANERVVPREEQPVDVTAAVSRSAPAADAAPPAQQSAAPAPALNEPKKVRTLAVRADGIPGASPVSAYAAEQGSAMPDPAAQGASAMPPAAASGAYVVQVASQRTEADANGSWRALKQKYPAILGSYTASVKKADLGDRGIFFRAQVGPFATRDQANQLCQALHAQGGDCIVAKN